MFMFEHAEETIRLSINWLRLGIETVGAVIIALGVLVAIWAFLRRLMAGLVPHSQPDSFTAVRLAFARYLALGLEFQLAADILSTAVSPTWDQIGKLAAIAVIRTALNFFLMREMSEERPEVHRALDGKRPG